MKSISKILLLVVLTAVGYASFPYLINAQPNDPLKTETTSTSTSPKPVATITPADPTLLHAEQKTAPNQQPALASDYFLGASAPAQASPPFDTNAWSKKFTSPATFKYKTWPKPYAGGKGFVWWKPKEIDCAQRWTTPLGPLGIIGNPLNPAWQIQPGFDQFYPSNLKDNHGKLILTGILVTDIMPGSPAEGKIKRGDIITQIDNTNLLDASQIKPSLSWRTKEVRSLRPHIGWLLDRAEQKGSTTLAVIKNPHAIKTTFTRSYTTLSNTGKTITIPEGNETLRLELSKGSPPLSLTDFFIKNNNHPISPLVTSQNRAKLKENTLNLNSNKNNPSHIEILLPPGINTLHLSGTNPALIIQALPKLNASKLLKNNITQITIPLQKIGAYPHDFNPDSPKSVAVTKMTAAWILAQQRENGSWPRRAGYCSDGLDTATCIIALLSTGDDTYLPAIKKAAHYLAYQCRFDHWVTNESMAVLALSEYYLRTQDKEIINGIKIHSDALIPFLYADDTVGHGVNPGYGDGSVNYGGAHLALAWAVAEKTPAGGQPKLLRQMLERVQEMSPGGSVPYGRTSPTTFDGKMSTSYAAGARTGNYLTAAVLTGGPSYFISQASKHLSEVTLGGGDQGHATKTFSLFGTTLGIASAAPEILPEHLRRHSWAITSNRRFDGGFHWGSDPIEYQGAETVMHDLYRASTYLILLNSGRHNLAITGRKDLVPTQQYTVPKLTVQDARIHRSYVSRLAIAEATIKQAGKSIPPALSQTIDSLIALQGKYGPDMREQILSIMQKALPTITNQVELLNLTPDLKSQTFENIYGANLELVLQPKKDAQPTDPLVLKINARLPLPALKETPTYAYQAIVSLKNTKGNWLPTSISHDFDGKTKVDLKKSLQSTTLNIPIPQDQKPREITATIAIKIGDTVLQRNHTIHWPLRPENNASTIVPGYITRNHLRHTLIFKTILDREIPCINALITKPLPVQKEGRDLISDFDSTAPLIEGTAAKFYLSQNIDRIIPTEIWTATHLTQPDIPLSKIIWNTSTEISNNEISDYIPETTTTELTRSNNPEQTLTFTVQKPTTAKNLYFRFEGKRPPMLTRVEAKTKDGWKTIGADASSGATTVLQPKPAIEYRLTFITLNNAPLKLSELHLYR